MDELNEMKQYHLLSTLENVRNSCRNQKDCRACPYYIPRKDDMIDCLPAIIFGTLPLNLNIEDADKKLGGILETE